MSTNIEYINEVTPDDLDHLAMNLREVEKMDLLRAFESVKDGLMSCWAVSKFARVVRVNGVAVAIFGLSEYEVDGTRLGVPWMLGVDLPSYAHPVTIVKEARKYVKKMQTHYPVMANTVPVEDEEAHALIEAIGFELVRDTPVKVGGYEYFQFWFGRAS